MSFFFHLECLLIFPLCITETYNTEEKLRKKKRKKEIIYHSNKKNPKPLVLSGLHKYDNILILTLESRCSVSSYVPISLS